MDEILLYRIENEEGQGVYTTFEEKGNKSIWFKVSKLNVDNNMQPPPYNSILNYNENKRELFFAFSSLEQLRNWFYDDYWLLQFEELGFKLVVYKTQLKYCKRDVHQAVFEKERASKLAKISLNTLVKNKFNLELNYN